MLQRIDEIEKTVADLPTRAKKPEKEPPDFTFLTVDDYIVKRVDDQISYYDTKRQNTWKRTISCETSRSAWADLAWPSDLARWRCHYRVGSP